MNSIRSFPQLADQMIHQTKKSVIGKHVAWLKKHDNSFFVKVLKILECTLLSVSLIGIPFILKGYSYSRKLNDYNTISKISSQIFSPPEIDKVVGKTITTSFNHVNEYVLKDDLVWFKPLNTTRDQWQLMYFDGYARNEKPEQMSVDEANFTIMDHKGQLHYKKVLDETRYWFLNDKYSAKDLTKEDNWYDAWFSLPIIRHIYHLFKSRTYTIPEGTHAWGISHRGKYVRHYNDRGGRAHPYLAMVTTLCMVPKNRKNIHCLDPYWFTKFTIKGPSKDFTIDGMSPAGSTIMVVGREKNEPQILTHEGDFDSKGKNPILPSFWIKAFRPKNGWKLHKLPPGKLTDIISLSVTGTGSNSRLMQIHGIDPQGNHGEWKKNITDEQWTFSKT